MNITIDLPGHFEGVLNTDHISAVEKTPTHNHAQKTTYELVIRTHGWNYAWVFSKKENRDRVYNDISRMMVPASGLLYTKEFGE